MLIDIQYGVPDSYDLGGGPIKYVKSTDASNPKRQLYLCHNKCELGSTPLVDGLKPIAAFLKSHPREVMVFVNEDYIAPADFAAAATKAGLLKYIYKGSPTRFPTLGQMISSPARRDDITVEDGAGEVVLRGLHVNIARNALLVREYRPADRPGRAGRELPRQPRPG